MRITLRQAAIGHGIGAEVPPISIDAHPGAVTVVAVQGDERPLLVSLLLGGRLNPDTGQVLIDGREDLTALRLATGLVDTPFVADPPPGVSLASVVAEEFGFASRPTSGRAVREFLDAHGIGDYAKLAVRSLPPTHRVRLFTELALLRPLVTGVIITSPERHGGNPADWYGDLADIARRGTTVIVVTDATTRDILIRLGARDATAPLVVES